MKVICEKSVSGKIWTLAGDPAAKGDVVDSILERRGILDNAAKHAFLNPSLMEQMPDPEVLAGMREAVRIAADFIKAEKKIAIFGDYDVDGITGTAVLIKFLRQIGANVVWRLPDRESEGYGLGAAAVEDFAKDGAELLITVDCGICAIDEVALAKRRGMSVIVTDHHDPMGTLPDADAIINPKQPSDTSNLDCLAGVGVAFMFAVALNRELEHPVKDMMRFLDLVALGTICDTMPLTGINRAIVKSGLKVLAQSQNIGLRALMETARVKKTDVYSAGFIIGPRLNAAGRIIDANLALDLILTDNYIKAHDLAGELDEMNARRQAIQNKILLDADDLAKKQKDANRFCLFVSGDDWHGGVMGIVAGRLKEKYGLPCCVATRSKASVKGSGRSIEGVDIGKIIRLALENGIISEGGGHKAAAGFELAPENEQRFSDFLDNEVKSALNGIYPIPKINADIEMDAGGATLELAENIEKLAPFGIGNTEPILCLSGGMWTFGRTIGTGAHLSGNLKTSAGNLSVVGFNMSDTPIGRFLLDESNFGCKIRVVGRLKENDFSSNVQLLLEDIAL